MTELYQSMWNYESKVFAEWIGVGPNILAKWSQAGSYLGLSSSAWGIIPIGLSEGVREAGWRKSGET